MNYDITELIAQILAVIAAFCLLIVGAFAFNSCSKGEDIDVWNGGYHKDCGGRWEYEQAIGHRNDTDYIYVCDKCGMRHEFDSYFNGGK